jgi:predicted permease
MNWFARIFGRRDLYGDLADEVLEHLEEKTEQFMRDGMSREEATRAARRAFGNAALIEERGREAWQWPRIESLLADAKFAMRQLRRSPGFAVTAVLTLALGIGANTAIFTLIDSIMLQPLPYPQQGRLMAIDSIENGRSGGYFPKGWIRAWEEHSQSFASISGYGPNVELNITGNDQSERVFGSGVTVNSFDTLGIHPAIGSFFSPENAVAGQDLVVVLSYGYWRQHFAGSPGVIGQTVRIDGISRKIIGVMPAGVRFPYADTQFLLPIAFKGGDPMDPWKGFWEGMFNGRAIGRLKDGVSPAAAQAELRRLQPALLKLFPWTMPSDWEAQITVVPLLESVVGDTRPRLLLLFGSVGMILLIACANVANLMLARATSREREMAIRGALGASATRIIRQLLVESVLLGAMAGVVGLVLAGVSLRALTGLLPADTPRIADIALHWPVFLFAAAASVLTGVLFGLVPAVRMASPDLQEGLRSGSRSIAGKASQGRISTLLVMGQIGLSVLVITAAGLMLHSLYSLSRVDPGFRTDRIVTAEVSLDATACRQPGRCQIFFRELLEKAQGIAGVENVALADSMPIGGYDMNYAFDAEDNPRQPTQKSQQGTEHTVSAGYFDTVGLKLIRGRLLTGSDQSGASRAVVINQRMAQALWPNQNPIGKHIEYLADEPAVAVLDPNVASVVAGVVSDTHHEGLGSAFDDEVYLPMTAKYERPVMTILLRSHVGAAETAAELRRAVAEIDPLVPVTRVRTMDEVVAASTSDSRSLTLLLLGFGFLAVSVGAVGVYSLIAYTVSWRTREIGIRLALGARRRDVVMMIVRQSFLLALGGSLAGLGVAAVSGRLLKQFLFEVSPFDPITFLSVPLLMILLALLAAWLPARRASSIDPMKALRTE